MTEIIYRIPSAIPYAYVEIHAQDISELPDPAMLAAHYAAYYDAYSKEEKEAIKRALEGPKRPDPRDSIGDPHKAVTEAVRALDEGLGGVTKLEDLIEVSGIAPWDDSDLKAEAKPKPWETDVTAPAVLDAIW